MVTWTWPDTLIPNTQGEPTPQRYTNLKTDAQKHSIKHTYTPLFPTTKHSAFKAIAASDGANFSFHTEHTSLTHTQFTHKEEFM
jgi:hypothetical protein